MPVIFPSDSKSVTYIRTELDLLDLISTPYFAANNFKIGRWWCREKSLLKERLPWAMCYSATDSACHIQRVDILYHCKYNRTKMLICVFQTYTNVKYSNKLSMNIKHICYYVSTSQRISQTHIPNLKRPNLAIRFLLQLMAFMVHGIPNAPSPSLFQYSTLTALL